MSQTLSQTLAPSGRKDEVSSRGDLQINNLIYKQPKSLSLAVNRTMKRQPFHQTTYAQSTIAYCDWNTGSDYVNPGSSYLTFKVALTGTTPTGNFGNGSAVNLIQQVTITGRSSTELDRTNNVNLWSKQYARNTYSNDWMSNFGAMAGFGSTGIGGMDDAILSSTATRYVIPLPLISGFFRPVGGQPIPPQLASGLKIELQLADYRTAIFESSGTVTGYDITDIRIVTDSITYADDTQKTLNMESASSGLEYTYPRVYDSTSTVSSSSFNAQIRKGVSQALSVTALLRLTADITDVTKDSLKSAAWDVSEWQMRLGNLYFPHQPISDPLVDGLESFFMQQSCHGKTRNGHSENDVSLVDFVTNGFGAMTICLEKDQALNLSGQPLNSSRVMELTGTLANYAANNELTVFLEYITVVKAYIDNVVSAI